MATVFNSKLQPDPSHITTVKKRKQVFPLPGNDGKLIVMFGNRGWGLKRIIKGNELTDARHKKIQ